MPLNLLHREKSCFGGGFSWRLPQYLAKEQKISESLNRLKELLICCMSLTKPSITASYYKWQDNMAQIIKGASRWQRSTQKMFSGKNTVLWVYLLVSLAEHKTELVKLSRKGAPYLKWQHKPCDYWQAHVSGILLMEEALVPIKYQCLLIFVIHDPL